MRLNLGAGHVRLRGWTSVDATDADIVCDLKSIPLPDECADEAMAIHVIEHFYRWEVPAVLAEWKRLLKPGARLVLECPDILKCAMNLVARQGDQMSMWGIYGDPSSENQLMTHRWGWTTATLEAELLKAGFVDVESEPTRFHPVGREHRDMRLVARKPNGRADHSRAA